MSDHVAFQRNPWGLGPKSLYAGAGILALNGIGHLVDRHWLWAAADLVVAILMVADMRWLQRTPLVRVDGGQLVIRRHMLWPSRRLAIDGIAAVDTARPSTARLQMQSGQSVSIPLHWFAWDDRARFLGYLHSVCERGDR